MTKISMLRAGILRMHRDLKELSTLSIQAAVRDLQQWYDRLPAHIALESLGLDGIPIETKRSICHTHLLYLGAIILSYCMITPRALRLPEGTEALEIWKPHEKLLIERAEQAVLAATTSARVVKVLHEQNGVFKHCWLVMYVLYLYLLHLLFYRSAAHQSHIRFQTYTSCLMILHCAAQKQIHNFNPETWKDDLYHANLCLNILSFCGTADPTAAKYHNKLIDIYKSLVSNMNFAAGTSETPAVGTNIAQIPEALLSFPEPFLTSFHTGPIDGSYIFTVPPDADPRLTQLSNFILNTLCQPSGDTSTMLFATDLHQDTSWGYTTQVDEGPQWGPENKGSFDLGASNMSSVGGVSNYQSSLSGVITSTERSPREFVSMSDDADNSFLESMGHDAWTLTGSAPMN